ncbi:MAG: helix-turn-helix transcriptional regulator [Oscillibacter sp.]|jgi:transcriptional regulator with XRE-family HTH domain|nr:helix-turn-helix transcriptional regulator [Oscillibacter sp.]
MKEYYEILRELREDHDYSQQQIAEVLNTTQQVYSRYERGINELPVRHLKALCRFYHVSADYVLGLPPR